MSSSYERYLRLLGLPGRPAGLPGLRLLLRRHLAVVPFENISKLLLWAGEGTGRLIGPEEYVDGIEHRHLGGTCYTINPHFAGLLRHLGYRADLLGADMSRPNVHTAIRVHLDGVQWHVDAGFAAPFREPIGLNALPATIEEGRNRYRFAAVDGGHRMEMVSGDENAPSYTVHDPPREPEFFLPAVLDSFAPAAIFMRTLRISRVFDHYSLDLAGRRIYRHEDGKTTSVEVPSMEALRAAVAGPFGMTRCPVEDAVRVLESITGEAFFGSAGTAVTPGE